MAVETSASSSTAMLRGLNYEVTSVDNLTDAIRLAEDEEFDLYLISHKMEGGTGLDLCRSLRHHDGETPILYWSALVYEADRKRAIEAGASIFLKQPDDFAVVPSTITKLINAKDTASHA